MKKPNPWLKTLNTPLVTEESQIKTAVLNAIAANASADKLVERTPPDTLEAENPDRIEKGKLSRLISDDFPFDESQLNAIEGMARVPYACLTGAAGTGKTTTTKKLVDTLLNQSPVGVVDMREYWKAADPEDADGYEQPESWIPSIAMVGFTGRSTQMIKKNFNRDWHGNIMTIHRLLGFKPDYYEDWNEELQEYRTKMRFIPSYNMEFKLPWDIIIIDEAGMVGLELWHQLYDAMKKGCRVYMIGDINQLPPVHGRSIFGFAMSQWPSFELTHIHRQQGVNNPIVENAWKVLQGITPKTDGRFQMIELKGDADMSSRKVQAMMPKLKEMGVYEPNRDAIITAINGLEHSNGRALGQEPLNERFSLIFNPSDTHPRYVIDAGRERKRFAVGDKVMATKNDYEAGITNGMTGVVTRIIANAAYTGERRRFGLIEDVTAYLNEVEDSHDDDDDDDFTLEDLKENYDAINAGKEARKEARDRGPASHIVTVQFGADEYGFDIDFATLSEVASLMTAYVVTCHKMQGGESPTVVIICHDSHRKMLYREWLYTAITRGSERVILLYSKTALSTALNKQNIKGKTLKEKIHAFNLLQRDNGAGVSIRVRMPRYNTESDEVPDGPTDLVLADEPPPPAPAVQISTAEFAESLGQPKARRANGKPIDINLLMALILAMSNQKPKGPVDLTATEVEPESAGPIMLEESLDAELARAFPMPRLTYQPDYVTHAWPAEWSEEYAADTRTVGPSRSVPTIGTQNVADANGHRGIADAPVAPASPQPQVKVNPWAKKLAQYQAGK